MANYSIQLTESAAREIRKIKGKKSRRRVVNRIATLTQELRPEGSRKLSAGPIYRMEESGYRILYILEGEKVVVAAVR